MKKILVIMLLLTVATSCKKYLETLPTDFLVANTYYSTDAQVTSALMAVYTIMGETGENTWSRFLSLEAPIATDEEHYRQSLVWAGNYNTDASYAKYNGCWTQLYLGISRANALLEALPTSTASTATVNEIRGEALFLRAFYYFTLVTYWGDVPLRLKFTASPTDVAYARTPSKEIYDQIIADMTTAEGLVKTSAQWGNAGRVSQTVAEGMLARVCLHAAGRLNDPSYYQKSLTWSTKCINSGQHSFKS